MNATRRQLRAEADSLKVYADLYSLHTPGRRQQLLLKAENRYADAGFPGLAKRVHREREMIGRE